MKNRVGLLTLSMVSTAVFAVEYKEGWDACEFYEEVTTSDGPACSGKLAAAAAELDKKKVRDAMVLK